MQWTTPDLPVSVPVTYVVAGIAATIVGIAYFKLSQRPNLDAVPTVGSSTWLGSWWAGIMYVTNAADVIQEGCKKHNGATFKVAKLYRWAVIVSKPALVEDLKNARDDELSFMAASNEDLNTDFTIGLEVMDNPYHIAVTRSQLTRNIGVLCPELRDEIITAFDEILDLRDNEWKGIPALTTVRQIVCRVSNRSFVGLPLCRNPDYVDLNIQYTIDIIKGGITIGLFPRILRPLAARLITNVPKNTRRGVRHLRPVIEERRKYTNEYGSASTENPNDLLSWLMDEAGPDITVELLTRYVLAANIAAIHSTSNVFTIALYNLAANPQYVEPLRKEVEAIVKKEGWSKKSVAKMRKVDSFLKESIRLEGVSMLGLTRKAMKDFMFSDGTLIPKGTRLNAGLIAMHYDDASYENAEVFNPFRFADMPEENGEGAKHQLVSTSTEYLSFGHGRHACPGRFFAATEMKMMLAHILMTYDLKLEENTTRPRSLYIGAMIGANPTAKVMFRKRALQNEEH